MVQHVEVKTLCDLCWEAAGGNTTVEAEGDPIQVAFDGNSVKELDLCGEHRRPFLELREVAGRLGRVLKAGAARTPSTPKVKPPRIDTALLRTDTGTFRCPECGFESPMPQGIGAHMSAAHGPRSTKGAVACEVCGQPCAGGQGLTAHMRTHTDADTMPCPVCGKGCHGERGLKSHLRTHDPRNNTNCPVCGRAYMNKAGLAQHLRMAHPDYRPGQENADQPANQAAMLGLPVMPEYMFAANGSSPDAGGNPPA